MENIIKYPRTRHIEGSRLQAGDEDLKSIKFDTIKDSYLVLEEKVDGANCGISFSEEGRLLLQSRGHYLNGSYTERQFDLFKTWAGCFQQDLYQLLGNRYIMYGEWLYAKHTVFYDELTHYFMEFDIYDKEKERFLSTKKRQDILKDYKFIISVRILAEGEVHSLDELISYLGKSAFKSERCMERLMEACETLGLSGELVRKQTDSENRMEGIYIKEENEDFVLNRFKYVRASFLNTILNSETHWANRPIVANLLKVGTDIFSTGNEVI